MALIAAHLNAGHSGGDSVAIGIYYLPLTPPPYPFPPIPTNAESPKYILRAPRHQNCTPLLQQLHWLPISERIKYKTACMCYNAITGSAPSYFSELLHLYSPSRSSSDTRMLNWNPTLQPQNPWLSHFLTLWSPHLEQSPPRHQTLCYSFFLPKSTQDISLLRIFQLNHIVLHSHQSVQCVCVCVCARACARVRACGCVCACVCVHLLHNYAWTLVDIAFFFFW